MKPFFAICFLFIIVSCHTHDKDPQTAAKTDSIPSEAAMTAAVKQYPDSMPLLENLVQYYSNTENYTSALSYINQAIARDSARPELWDMQSLVLVEKSDTLPAIHALEHAVALYPDPQYIISLGALYAETKNEKALAMADALIAADKSHANKEAFFIRGLYYSFRNMKEKAIPFFDQALAEDYQFMDAYLEKALALYDLEKYDEAATVLTKAVALQNNFDRGYFYLGRCYEKLNKKEEAANAYRKALMYDPEYTEAQEALEKLAN